VLEGGVRGATRAEAQKAVDDLRAMVDRIRGINDKVRSIDPEGAAAFDDVLELDERYLIAAMETSAKTHPLIGDLWTGAEGGLGPAYEWMFRVVTVKLLPGPHRQLLEHRAAEWWHSWA
jgi:hypothetical protein